jgi:hypothetical protein
MPLVPPTASAWLKRTLNSLQAQITAIATQQNHGVVDSNLTPRIKWGWQQEFNTYGIAIFDSSGNRWTTLRELPDGNHGVAIYDQNNDGGYVELNAPESAGGTAAPLAPHQPRIQRSPIARRLPFLSAIRESVSSWSRPSLEIQPERDAW